MIYAQSKEDDIAGHRHIVEFCIEKSAARTLRWVRGAIDCTGAVWCKQSATQGIRT